MSFSPCKPLISDDNKSEDIILFEQIKGKKSVIRENIDSNDSIYHVLWQKSYDLNGLPKDSSSRIQVIIHTKSGGRIVATPIYGGKGDKNIRTYPPVPIETKLRIDSILRHEQHRTNVWLEKLNVPKLIKDKEPCINHEFEFAKVLCLCFFYEIVPATVKNDSINGK